MLQKKRKQKRSIPIAGHGQRKQIDKSTPFIGRGVMKIKNKTTAFNKFQIVRLHVI